MWCMQWVRMGTKTKRGLEPRWNGVSDNLTGGFVFPSGVGRQRRCSAAGQQPESGKVRFYSPAVLLCPFWRSVEVVWCPSVRMRLTQRSCTATQR